MDDDINSTNISLMSTEYPYTPYEQRLETYLVPVLFFIIFVVGVIGNGTLVIIFLRHRAMRNVPNTYIFSLALADLLVIITCIPFTSIIYTVESWPWGVAVCKISESSRDISIGVSVFTLTALSAERYCAIVNPLRRLRTKPFTVFSAVMIWFLAVILALPGAIFSRLEYGYTKGNKTITFCTPFLDIPNYAKYNVIFKSLTYYVIPLAIIALFYVFMAIRLHISANEMPGNVRGTQGIAQARARRHVARMVLIFVFLFFICFLPHHVCMLWFHVSPNSQEEYNDWWHATKIVGFCLSFLNSCVNPIALYCVSGVFRTHFNRYLCCQEPRWPRNAFSVSETSFKSTSRRHTQSTTVEHPNTCRKEIVTSIKEHNDDALIKNDSSEVNHRKTTDLGNKLEIKELSVNELTV